MNTLEEAKALVVKEFERRKVALEQSRDLKLETLDWVFTGLDLEAKKPVRRKSLVRVDEVLAESEEMETVTVGQVDEIRVDQEPMGLPDQAADGIPKMTVTVEKTAQDNLEVM